MVINIKDKSQFVNGYLRPISALTEAVIIKSNDNKLQCIANNEQGLIIYASYDIDIEETYNQINELMDLGYKIDIIDTATCTQSIMIDDGEFIGVSDLRRPDSLALGVKND